MKCWRCGKEIPDDALYCPYCGVRVAEAPGKEVVIGPHPPRTVSSGIIMIIVIILMLATTFSSTYVHSSIILLLIIFLTIALIYIILGVKGKRSHYMLPEHVRKT